MSADTVALSAPEAEALLDAAEAVVPCLEMPLADAKSMREKLLAEGVPVAFGRDDHCTSGCSPKVLLLARQDDVPRITALLRRDWAGMLANETGDDPEAMHSFLAKAGGADPEAEPPCPACGHTGALDAEGACGGCGLVLG